MRSKAGTSALRDIAHNIDLAMRFSDGLEFESFQHDPRTVYAVTRCLEGVTPSPGPCESAASIDCLEGQCRCGEYLPASLEDVNADQVWDTLKIDLPPLRTAIALKLANLD